MFVVNYVWGLNLHAALHTASLHVPTSSPRYLLYLELIGELIPLNICL
jgi:hypothetical protein